MYLIATVLAAETAAAGVSPVVAVAGSFGLDPRLFLAQLLNFGLLVLILWGLLYRPLVRFMEERSARITEGLKNAARAEERLQAIEAERQGKLAAADDEARRMLTRASEQADELKRQARVEAEAVAAEVRERAAREAEQTKQQVLVEVRASAADLVVLATEKVLRQRLDQAADRRLVEQALKEI